MLMHIGGIVALAFILVISGTLLLRISGNRSLTELTLASTIVMFVLGEILSEPMRYKSVWETLLTMGTCLATLKLLEWLQVKMSWLRRLLLGRSFTIIEEGRMVRKQMRKLRMTEQDIDLRLREKGIFRKSDVRKASIETNGKVTVELMPQAQPATRGDLERLFAEWSAKLEPVRTAADHADHADARPGTESPNSRPIQ